MYEPLTQLIRPLPVTKKLHAKVKLLHELNSQHPAREAALKKRKKSGCLVKQTSHGGVNVLL